MKCKMAADQVLKRFARQIRKEDASNRIVKASTVGRYVVSKFGILWMGDL